MIICQRISKLWAHGFAEKLQLEWNRLSDEIEAFGVLHRSVNLIFILCLNPGMYDRAQVRLPCCERLTAPSSIWRKALLYTERKVSTLRQCQSAHPQKRRGV